MAAPHDIMTQMILAQITDLQRRVTNQDAVIAALKEEIQMLHRGIPFTPVAPIPCYSPPMPQQQQQQQPQYQTPQQQQQQQQQQPRPIKKRPTIASAGTCTGAAAGTEEKKADKPQWNLSTILEKDEEVTVSVGVGRNDRGAQAMFTTLTTIFDGKEFIVTATADEEASSLIGFKTDKPGAILFKFIDALHSAGIIKEKFSIAPWKLCSVVRGGKRLTLESLAKNPIIG